MIKIFECNDKNYLNKYKESAIYKEILENFPDAELLDFKIGEKNNDWFFEDSLKS